MAKLKDIKTSKTHTINTAQGLKVVKFNLNAFAELEEIYGGVQEAFKAFDTNKIKHFINFLWAGLLHENDSLTVKEVGNLIEKLNLSELSTILSEALIESMPTAKEDEQEKKTATE